MSWSWNTSTNQGPSGTQTEGAVVTIVRQLFTAYSALPQSVGFDLFCEHVGPVVRNSDGSVNRWATVASVKQRLQGFQDAAQKFDLWVRLCQDNSGDRNKQAHVFTRYTESDWNKAVDRLNIYRSANLFTFDQEEILDQLVAIGQRLIDEKRSLAQGRTSTTFQQTHTQGSSGAGIGPGPLDLSEFVSGLNAEGLMKLKLDEAVMTLAHGYAVGQIVGQNVRYQLQQDLRIQRGLSPQKQKDVAVILRLLQVLGNLRNDRWHPKTPAHARFARDFLQSYEKVNPGDYTEWYQVLEMGEAAMSGSVSDAIRALKRSTPERF